MGRQELATGGGTTTQNIGLTVFFTNIRSLLPKRDDLCALINDCSADIIALTETWLYDKMSDSELYFCEKNYNIFQCDRYERNGSGVILAVNEHIECFRIAMTTSLEIVWCCMTLCFKKIIFGVCYRPPLSPISFCDDLHD